MRATDKLSALSNNTLGELIAELNNNFVQITGGNATNLGVTAMLDKLIPIPITGQTDGQRWKKSHNEVSKIARFKWH